MCTVISVHARDNVGIARTEIRNSIWGHEKGREEEYNSRN